MSVELVREIHNYIPDQTEDQNNKNIYSESGYCIFSWENKHICLICKVRLNTGEQTESYENLNHHLVCNEHKFSLMSLFKKHLQDPECATPDLKHDFFVKNSYTDFLASDHKPIFKIGSGEIFCTICKFIISSPLKEELDVVILDHVKDSEHTINLKNILSWICPFPSRAGIVKFYKNVVYCSVCGGSLFFKEGHALQAAVNHLEADHPSELELICLQQNENYKSCEQTSSFFTLDASNDYSVNSSLETIKSSISDIDNTWYDADIEKDISQRNSDGKQLKTQINDVIPETENFYSCDSEDCSHLDSSTDEMYSILDDSFDNKDKDSFCECLISETNHFDTSVSFEVNDIPNAAVTSEITCNKSESSFNKYGGAAKILNEKITHSNDKIANRNDDINEDDRNNLFFFSGWQQRVDSNNQTDYGCQHNTETVNKKLGSSDVCFEFKERIGKPETEVNNSIKSQKIKTGDNTPDVCSEYKDKEIAQPEVSIQPPDEYKTNKSVTEESKHILNFSLKYINRLTIHDESKNMTEGICEKSEDTLVFCFDHQNKIEFPNDDIQSDDKSEDKIEEVSKKCDNIPDSCLDYRCNIEIPVRETENSIQPCDDCKSGTNTISKKSEDTSDFSLEYTSGYKNEIAISLQEVDNTLQPSHKSENNIETVEKNCENNSDLCSECKNKIEILNMDINFSKQVHSQKHRVLTNINGNESPVLKFEENTDYLCSHCDEVITVYNKNVELSFQLHTDHCLQRSSFFTDILDKLHGDLQKYRPFLKIKFNSIYCELCQCPINTDKYFKKSFRLLKAHLALQYHVAQYELCISTKKEVKSSSPKKCLPITKRHPSEITQIKTVFTDVPDNLRVHQEFFTFANFKLTCQLCSEDVSASQSDLKNHINGLSHKLQFFASLKKNLPNDLRPQVKFLIFLCGQLYCSRCQRYMSPWNDFSGICGVVKDHFESISH